MMNVGGMWQIRNCSAQKDAESRRMTDVDSS